MEYNLPEKGTQKELLKFAAELMKNCISHDARVLAGITKGIAIYYTRYRMPAKNRLNMIELMYQSYKKHEPKLLLPLANGSRNYHQIFKEVKELYVKDMKTDFVKFLYGK